jgi:hypothetical protein
MCTFLQLDDIKVTWGVWYHWNVQGGQNDLKATIVATEIEGCCKDRVKVSVFVYLILAWHYFEQIKTEIQG